MRDDWDDLRFVLAVAEAGTVSAAARRLGVNHATVLRRIAQFEERTGNALFDKTQRGYSLAPDLGRVLEALRDVERSVQAVARTLSGARAPLSGEVRVTSTDSICQVLLPPLMPQIAAEAPGLRVTLISSNAYVDLGRTQADITLRPTERLPDDLVGDVAGRLAFGLYQARGAGATEWLALTGQLERTLPARWMAGAIDPAARTDGADSFLTLRELAARGRGLAILPRFVGDGDARLERIEGRLPPMAVDLWVASHADMAAVPRIALLRRLLARVIADCAGPALSGEAG